MATLTETHDTISKARLLLTGLNNPYKDQANKRKHVTKISSPTMPTPAMKTLGVAVASPDRSGVKRIRPEKTANTVTNRYRIPATFAALRGDISAIRVAISILPIRRPRLAACSVSGSGQTLQHL